jgi:carboxylesterase
VILSGGEPFYLPGGPYGSLLIHGFLSTPQEMKWLGSKLNEAGYSALGLRLFGHATHPRDLCRVRWLDWLACVEDGYSILRKGCNRIVVVGLSLGGAMALIAGALFPIDGVVALSAPYDLPQYARVRWPILPPALSRFLCVNRKYRSKSTSIGYLDSQAARSELIYPVFPATALHEVAQLLAEMRRVLPNIRVPTLLIHSSADQGFADQDAKEIFDHLGTKKAQILHVESGDMVAPQPVGERVAAAIIAFITSLCGTSQ